MGQTKRPVVAIVEDHDDTRSMLELLLQDHFTIMVFGSSEAALTGLEGTQPDLLVIDIGMPCIDGEQLLGYLKSKMPASRAVAFTGYSKWQSPRRYAAFDAVIYKPEVHMLIDEIYRLTACMPKQAS
jgi:CheY-like chemotaxis protein